MKPGSERIACILVGLWAATIIVMFATDWLEFAQGEGFWWFGVLGVAYIGVSIAIDEVLSRRAKR
jgi:type IV secretory pathway TrbD component